MDELDEIWSRMLKNAVQNARSTGRHDIAEYLSLKETNDAIRRTAVQWLFDGMIEIATNPGTRHMPLDIAHADRHNFRHRGSNIVGAQLRLSLGVRSMTLEAGWTRTPTDGFMRGGAMAVGRIGHFGVPAAETILYLMRSGDFAEWREFTGEKAGPRFDSSGLMRHFQILIGS